MSRSFVSEPSIHLGDDLTINVNTTPFGDGQLAHVALNSKSDLHPVARIVATSPERLRYLAGRLEDAAYLLETLGENKVPA